MPPRAWARSMCRGAKSARSAALAPTWDRWLISWSSTPGRAQAAPWDAEQYRPALALQHQAGWRGAPCRSLCGLPGQRLRSYLDGIPGKGHAQRRQDAPGQEDRRPRAIPWGFPNGRFEMASATRLEADLTLDRLDQRRSLLAQLDRARQDLERSGPRQERRPLPADGVLAHQLGQGGP